MKLLLTSDGLTTEDINNTLMGLLPKQASDVTVLIVDSAKLPEEMKYVEIVKAELEKFGVKKENITRATIAKNIRAADFGTFDVVYSCGGNSYYILDRMRKTGFDQYIINHVRINGVYIGVSAGSIIVGEDIRIAGWGSEGDKNEIALKDLKGFGITNIAIFPHYKPQLKKEIEEFRKTVSYPVQTLKDGEAMLITERSTMIIK